MSCTVPSTTSPGKLHLGYQSTTSSVSHTISWWLVTGAPISTFAVMAAEANRLAVYLTDCVPDIVRFTDWKCTAPDGSFIQGGTLGGLGPGTHTINSNMQGWKSLTVAFVGHARPGAPGNCTGESISRLHNFGTLDILPGTKEILATVDPAFEDFVNVGLNSSDVLPADRYGQNVVIELSMPIQWNAYTQRKEGS